MKDDKEMEILKRVLKNSIKINSTLDLICAQQDTIDELKERIEVLESKINLD